MTVAVMLVISMPDWNSAVVGERRLLRDEAHRDQRRDGAGESGPSRRRAHSPC